MLALLPLGVLSLVQTRDALNELDASTLKGVGGAALQAVRDQSNLIRDAQVSARVLARSLGRPNADGVSCMGQVVAIAEEIPQATVVAYVPTSGLLTCSSDGKVHDLSANESFLEIRDLAVPTLVYSPHGAISQQAVIGIRHPVLDPDGTLTGFVAISLAYDDVAPDTYVDAVAKWSPVYMATFTADGSVLVATDREVDPQDVIPGNRTLKELESLADRPTFVEDNGNRRILSVVSVARDLFVVSVWQPDSSSFWLNVVTPYFLPVLTWIAALVAAAFASSRLVVRHVRSLSRSMTDYVTTQRRVQIPDLSDAPLEIQRLHAAYEEMIRTIEQEEADLQNLVIDKDTLIREVNHRSGNSLQIIASIMRTYRRETTDQKLRSVLDGLINRVIALSSTHTSLYALSGQRDVAMDVVLANVVKRLKEIHGVALGVASKRLQPIRMDSQAAVPLALALAEAVGCFFARPGLVNEAVVVDLSETDGIIRLRIEGPEVPELRPEMLEGLVSLPQRMLRQFAAQLFGTVSIRQDGDRASVELTFSRPKVHH